MLTSPARTFFGNQHALLRLEPQTTDSKPAGEELRGRRALGDNGRNACPTLLSLGRPEGDQALD